MKRYGMRAGWLLVLLLLGGWDLFKSPNPDVERGNQAFRDGKYDEALGASGLINNYQIVSWIEDTR